MSPSGSGSSYSKLGVSPTRDSGLSPSSSGVMPSNSRGDNNIGDSANDFENSRVPAVTVNPGNLGNPSQQALYSVSIQL